MKTLTRCFFAQSLLLYGILAHSAADPGAAIAECRARYAEQPAEHIACLERELRAHGAPLAKSAPSLGSEQLRTKRPPETVDQASVAIENVSYGFDGKGLFSMTDGQVWKAVESTPPEQRLEPGKRYAGRIERGKLGGYRLYVEGTPRMVRVTRTK